MTVDANRVSDARLAEILHFCSVNDDAWTMSNDEVQALAAELESLRRSPSLSGGEEGASYRSPREDAAYFGSIWSLSTNQMAELEKSFEYHRDHNQSFGTDYPEGARSTEQSTLHPLADREKSASLPASPAPLEGVTVKLREAAWHDRGYVAGFKAGVDCGMHGTSDEINQRLAENASENSEARAALSAIVGSAK